MGAFKFRGAYNALAQLHARAAARRRRRVLVGQPRAGDRARGAAARHAGGDRDAARRAGREGRGDARLRRRGRRSTTATREDREAIGSALADERGMTLIPPYDHPDVIAGQGTAAKELIEEVGALDALFVCLGGGGLLAGSALAGARAARPAAGSTASSRRPATTGSSRSRAARSCTSRRRRRSPTARRRSTSASYTFPIIRRDVADIVTVERRRARRGDALLRRAHEDRRRADRLPRPSRRRCACAVELARPARRRDRQRRQRRPGALRRAARSARVRRRAHFMGVLERSAPPTR